VKREHKLTTKVVLAVIFEPSQAGEETEKVGSKSAQLYHLDREEGAEINDGLDHSKGYDSGLLTIGTGLSIPVLACFLAHARFLAFPLVDSSGL
jgi:hypothetical protein